MEQIIQKNKIVIKQIKTLEEIQSVENILIPMYKQIYSSAPDFQIWDEEFIKDLFKNYLNNGRIFMAFDDTKVVGFSVIVNFSTSSCFTGVTQLKDEEIKLEEHLQKNYHVNAREALYVTDLGVDPNNQKLGLGGLLIDEGMKGAEDKNIVIRASTRKPHVISFYEKRGFVSLGLNQYPIYKYIDGTSGREEKLILLKFSTK